MTRHEFPVAVKREAMARSNGQCEAVGERYGFPAGVRCQRRVYKGQVNYEHYPRGAHDPSPETIQIGNCTAICPQCNQFAANHTDKAVEAKIKRIRQKHGIDPVRRKHKPKPIRSPGFRKGAKQSWPSRKIPKRQA